MVEEFYCCECCHRYLSARLFDPDEWGWGIDSVLGVVYWVQIVVCLDCSEGWKDEGWKDERCH